MSNLFSRREMLAAMAAIATPQVSFSREDLLSPQQIEQIMADNFWRRFLAGEYQSGGETLSPVDDATFNRAVQDIAGPLFRRSTRSSLNWRIATANDSQPNAFTVGGGVVCLLRGIISICESEVELATVIAHEIGHVEYRHAIERIMAHQLFGSIDHRVLAARGGSANGQGVSAQLDKVAPEIIYQAYERLKEHEADAFAVRAIAAAGYDARHSHSLFEKFLALEEGAIRSGSCLMSSHPDTRERIARMKGLSRRYGKQRPRPDSDAFKYLKSVT